MGILNVTPDSFSDGGEYNRPDLALQHALTMIEQGVDIIDIGGESTRPGADVVSERQQPTTTEQQPTTEPLRMGGVGARTYKVGDNVNWRGMNLVVVEIDGSELLIATSDNVNDKDYNDWWVGKAYVR